MFMFFTRTVFWLSLVVLLVPVNKDTVETHASQNVTAGDAISLASGALSDLSDFCVRNPEVCVQGHEAFIAFSEKAKYVSAIAYSYINEQLADGNEVSADKTASLNGTTQKQS